MADAATLKIWDRFVRISHWSLVVLFAVSYLSEGEPRWLHVWSGYGILAFVVLRIVWGFIGSEHARFDDFLYRPSLVVRYLADLLRGRAQRHIGHSPAGGAMTIALLLSLLLTTFAGLALHAVHDDAGPLKPWLGKAARRIQSESISLDFHLVPAAHAHGDKDEASDGEKDPLKETLGEVHEILANFTLFLIIVHIGGVILASRAHRENLPRAMVTGEKRRDDIQG